MLNLNKAKDWISILLSLVICSRIIICQSCQLCNNVTNSMYSQWLFNFYEKGMFIAVAIKVRRLASSWCICFLNYDLFSWRTFCTKQHETRKKNSTFFYKFLVFFMRSVLLTRQFFLDLKTMIQQDGEVVVVFFGQECCDFNVLTSAEFAAISLVTKKVGMWR